MAEEPSEYSSHSEELASLAGQGSTEQAGPNYVASKAKEDIRIALESRPTVGLS